ncbi:hypothetical protein COV93_04815 [Candidatus Woesearchaeota archaeon CG11_big_fil_rev_8_21_14_0_20_43_8]|nr:MAG: hypothetical protein COV93_04815 [Candidatus Woesearchaeota archaeon CG11_big_fil_rev_8_21_14_0_20_43_8]
MNKKELDELISTGEGYTVEFKEVFRNSISKEICAFANGSGGRILLGVKDDGTIKGCNAENHLVSQIQDLARNMDPCFSVLTRKIENVFIILVPEGKEKPYSINGRFYLRIGSNSQQMNRDEIRMFFKKEKLIVFDEIPNTSFDLTYDLDKRKVTSYLIGTSINNQMKRINILKNLSLLDGKHLKNAGVLFFCRDVRPFFLCATICCVLYEGITKENIINRREFHSDVLSNFDCVFDYICSKLNTNYIIKKQRIEKLELPHEALREAIINAIAHRDYYYSHGHIQLDLFIDRLEISNPGGLMPGLDMKDLGKRSLPRNPLVMDLLLRIRKVEKVGSGIQRMRTAIKAYGLTIRFDISAHWFSVIFYRKSGGLSGGLNQPLAPIFELIKQNPGSKANEIAKRLNRPLDTIDKQIRQLVKRGIIERKGSKKTGGYWIL